MKPFSLLFLLFGALYSNGQTTFTVTVTNPSTLTRNDEPVVIALKDYGEVRTALVTTNKQEVACQLDDLDQDDSFDELCFLVNLAPKAVQHYSVTMYFRFSLLPRSAKKQSSSYCSS